MSAQAQFDPDAFMATQPKPIAAPTRVDASQVHAFDPDAFMASQQGGANQPQANPSLNASISATPQPTTIGGKVARWAQNVSDDIRYGTNLTGVGDVLQKMGAHGVYSGEPEKVGEYMASLPLGLLRATKGAGEVAEGKPGQGAVDIGAGGFQAATMPLTFVGGPETGEVGQAGVGTKAIRAGTAGTTYALDLVGNLIPSAERAGAKFQQVMSAAGDIPINITAPGNTALRTQQLAASGASMPKVMRDFIKRVTDPDKAALTYSEARDFYTNATRLSADEAQRLTPVMRRQVGQFTADLNRAISGAADQAGKLDQYQQAMSEYHNAMRLRAAKEAAINIGLKRVIPSALAGAGAVGAAKKLFGTDGK